MQISLIWNFALTYGGQGLEKFTCVDSKTWYHDRSYVIEGRQVFLVLTRRSLVSISCVSWFVRMSVQYFQVGRLNNYLRNKNQLILMVSSFFTTFDLRYLLRGSYDNHALDQHCSDLIMEEITLAKYNI